MGGGVERSCGALRKSRQGRGVERQRQRATGLSDGLALLLLCALAHAELARQAEGLSECLGRLPELCAVPRSADGNGAYSVRRKTEGYLGKPSAPMLILNGVKDTQVPIADLYTMLQSGGSAKEAWVNPDGGHTGRSEEWPNSAIFEEVILPWIKTHLAPDNQVTRAQRE
jgi:hypothetical protein